MAAMGGYAVGGHVPVLVIERLLTQRPAVQGIGVVGIMPTGSPGMVGPATTPYTAFTFGTDQIDEPYMTSPIKP